MPRLPSFVRSPAFAVLAVLSVITVATACSSDEDAGAPPPPRGGGGRGADGGGGSSPDGGVLEETDGSTTVGVMTCTDGQKNGDETDVDCGGSICPPCETARTCLERRDCVTRVCMGGKCADGVGCADGTREGFSSVAQFPNIAACSGAWSVPGVAPTPATTTPGCGRAAGNDGANRAGTGCSVADLCQAGWHVCATPAEVGAKSGSGCTGAANAGDASFFVTRQSGPGGAQCGAGNNDLFGCGGTGAAPDPGTCAPLDRFSNELCAALPATWSCGANGGEEASGVTKTASGGGGVLCCRD